MLLYSIDVDYIFFITKIIRADCYAISYYDKDSNKLTATYFPAIHNYVQCPYSFILA